MAELRRADFDAFMAEVTGFPPFPWQRRLLDRVLDSGWPKLLDLPTGSGKTSTLLVALFALALKPEDFHRRIALVVDRRIIVDQVDGFARRIHEALGDATKPVCGKLAAALTALSPSGHDAPVRVVHLRGGIPRDNSWLTTPDQPTIIASTVDQVGSRLLFRGYGVSDCMRPVHAGVLARDTLYLLDEVHLATAFEETLDRLESTYAGWAERDGTGRPFQVVRMSATPRDHAGAEDAFRLDDADRKDAVLAKRLEVSRPAVLELVKTKRASTALARVRNRELIAAAASAKAKAAAEAGATAIGVVVNRVDTARRAAARLVELDLGEVLLLTGRMRPYERAEVQARLDETVSAGQPREPDARPTFVVATSCIEAGADLDFDALVTEAASLDALRQRFGRLNRLGEWDDAKAWILGRKDQLSGKAEPDPIYREALRNTWDYLQANARTEGKEKRVDFGLEHFPEPADEKTRRGLLPPPDEAPVLFPSYLDMWSETRPAPHPDPDPTLWLHGKKARVERDVNVVFRADVPEGGGEQAKLRLQESLEFLPPLADEAVSVPLSGLAGWLGEGARVWRWSSDGPEQLELGELRPGDTIVLSASRGGLSMGTWNPRASKPVTDVAELVAWTTRELAKLRIDPSTLPAALVEGAPLPTSSDDPEELAAAEEACVAWLERLAERQGELPEGWATLVEELAKPEGKRELFTAESATGERIWRVAVVPAKRAVEATTEDEISVFSGAPVGLQAHLEDVRAWAAAFARAAGLDLDVAEDLALAGLLHDLGKADLRFQALLHGGDPIRAFGGELLAKSPQFGSARARARAAKRSGWPRGFRHELVSLALLDASPELREQANDLDLVRHLVASHHGWCRPWAPNVIDPEPRRVEVELAGVRIAITTAAIDADFLNACTSRFRQLCRRYGWHGLAYLEALLRLGDQRASHRPGTRPGGES